MHVRYQYSHLSKGIMKASCECEYIPCADDKMEDYLIGGESHRVPHGKEEHFHAHDSVAHCTSDLFMKHMGKLLEMLGTNVGHKC